MRDLFRQPLWVVIWVNILMAVNLAGVFFWSEPVSQVVFYTFMVTATWMIALYHRFQFQKILGLGHVLWLILVPYLVIVWPDLTGQVKGYIGTVILVNSLSLVFDINDVYQYFFKKDDVR